LTAHERVGEQGLTPHVTVPAALAGRRRRAAAFPILLLLCAVGFGARPAPAASQASIVVDAASGEVIPSSEPTALWRPPSLR